MYLPIKELVTSNSSYGFQGWYVCWHFGLFENSVAFREDQDAKKVDKRRSTGTPAPRKRKSGAKVANGESANGEYDDEPAMDTADTWKQATVHAARIFCSWFANQHVLEIKESCEMSLLDHEQAYSEARAQQGSVSLLAGSSWLCIFRTRADRPLLIEIILRCVSYCAESFGGCCYISHPSVTLNSKCFLTLSL